jgi:hypothetical protein
MIFDDFFRLSWSGDRWEKIDCPNLKKAIEMIATGAPVSQRDAPAAVECRQPTHGALSQGPRRAH